MMVEDAQYPRRIPFPQRDSMIDNDNTLDFSGESQRILGKFVDSKEIGMTAAHQGIVESQLIFRPEVQCVHGSL